MKLLSIATLVIVATSGAFAAEVKSPAVRQEICKEVGRYLDSERSESFDVKGCPAGARLDVKKETKATYTGETLTITLGDKTVTVLKSGESRTVRLDVELNYDSQICRISAEKAYPTVTASGGKLYVSGDGWNVDVADCKTTAESGLLDAELGDPNVKYVSFAKIPTKVRKNMGAYDMMPLIGYDGYYSPVENSYAQVKNQAGQVIGYLELALYAYTEDPEQHYWLFRYNAEGKLVSVPEGATRTIGDDVDARGSTRRWIQSGRFDL